MKTIPSPPLFVLSAFVFIFPVLYFPAQSLDSKTDAPTLESTIKEKTLPSPPKPKVRPSIALILSDGGARGFAHIPILELLEEEHIPVDMVIGTSAVLTDSSYSPSEQILDGHSTYEMFKQLTIKIPSDISFDNLHIPFSSSGHNGKYTEQPYLTINKLNVVNADPDDLSFIRKRFNKIKGKALTAKGFSSLSRSIYHTGKYRNVLTRIYGIDLSTFGMEIITLISGAVSILLRFGAGTTKNSVQPFFSIDMGNIRF
jgi:hypothetical protein